MKSPLLLLAVSLLALLGLTISYPSYHTPYGSNTLGIASRIYVLSLPRREDRRASMEYLRLALDLDWRYVGAFGEDNASASSASAQNPSTVPLPDYRFSWPDDLDSLADSEVPLSRSGSDDWSIYSDAEVSHLHPTAPVSALSQPPLACATENLAIPRNETSADDLPPYLQLTPAKIACWHSHLEILRAVAASGHDSGPAVVLEDDVDIEWDIGKRLNEVWSALPDDWDIVFLGHCWSDESQYLPLRTISTVSYHHNRGPKLFPYSFGVPFRTETALHPSVAPKCTHAYVVSHTGARRILLHLRHLPFAYSRAIDQALAWLISSGRLKSFSVVPSLVVQRKVGKSDVWTKDGDGSGSRWRDHLGDGVLKGKSSWAKTGP
ncbi:uncharacterized protein STEHIDRAFT_46292 [Stereum hirsutum FP-91666 SS1]|uniref:uncharacterized protein n=1 Tax=Stereum hirsutum (strain FP-91666) TaxID=721885 RepID=UPI000440B96A|nr:uncharacterized protein STEHIDRAFT_46292 [Stereum hirsutum FP-91666 SS1]EIM92044.1 hypothetical protein STEHIDRAFT_46292 [Stereum hirsutum FP-91666 SS1]